MSKKLISFLIVLSILLCGCGEREETADPEIVSQLSDAIAKTNSENRFSGKYMLEITFGDSAVLYYALGNVAWDSEKGVASAVFDQTYLGESKVMENYFSDNKMISVENENAIPTDRDASELFSKFPYAKLPEYSSNYGKITVSDSAQGKTFSLKRTDTKTLCDTLIGDDIYKLANVIKKPQPDKTQYGDTTCIYTVSDGKVIGCRYEFDIKLFDTPAYVPGGYSVPESDYTLDLHIIAKVTYQAFGEDVEVLEYSETSETSKE